MKIICAFLFLFQVLSSDSYPYFDIEFKKNQRDIGKGWGNVSNYSSLNYERFFLINHKQSESVTKFGDISFFSQGNEILMQGAVYRSYKNFFAYINPYISPALNKYKMKSGFGYKNDWVLLQISKDNENWGSGDGLELALGNKGEPYDYFLIGSDYGSIRVRYFHGFLEKINGNINRYINGRGIEWTNRNSIVIGISEIVIYTGKNRSFEIGYLNPIGSHLEIEMNNRSSFNDWIEGNANAVWQLHGDIYFKKLRFSGNILFDEFVLDPDIEKNKANSNAYSLQAIYAPKVSNIYNFSFRVTFIKVGTYTFRHGNGMNNFVKSYRPLGWEYGSDSQVYKISTNFFKTQSYILSASIGVLDSGERSILKNSYERYTEHEKTKFPSGIVRKTIFSDISYIHSFNKRTDLLLKLELMKKDQEKIEHNFVIGLGLCIDRINIF